MNKTNQIKQVIIDKTPLKKVYKEKELYQNKLLTLLSHDAVWVFSLMKAGTTYTALFLSNYFNYLYGDKKAVSFDRMNKEYCIHSIDVTLSKIDVPKLIMRNKFYADEIPGYCGCFTTHGFVNGGIWKKNISLYRNPLDFIISLYFFHYINRGIKCAHPRKIIKKKIKEFSNVISHQRQIEKQYPDKVLKTSYEQLMKQPQETFSKMIDFLELVKDENGILLSMKNSSKKKIKEMEEERGETIVKKDGVKFEGSFIRSGKIGEWKDYFDDNDLKNIDNELGKYGISLNEFELE